MTTTMMPRRFFLSGLFLLLIASSVSTFVRSAVLGIDYGAEFLKISIVAPGRSPITLVINEISKRKTTIAVSFVNDDRWLGEEAMNYQARYPEKVTTRLRELLGKDARSDLVLDYKEKYKLPFEIREGENRSTVEVSIGNNEKEESHKIEELVATTLQYAMKIGTALGKGVIKDAVVSVPPYFSQTQRRALYDAADIAGLNVMALVSDVSCAALQWGIDKDFAKNETRNVIFYDVGSSHSSASLVEFGALSERRSKKTYGSFVVKSVEWNDEFGGEDLDVLLVNHFLEEFKEKHGSETNGKDASQDKRAVAKLRKQVRKTKEMLSANKEAPVSVEGMFEDIDFRSTIDRATFEAKAEKTFHRILEPLRRLVTVELPKLGLTLEDVEAIEVIGGTVRVPAIQRLIDEVVLKDSGRSIDKRLDADEAVAMGAGLFAANMSTTFRMRKFGAADALPYGIDYQIVDQDNVGEENNNNNMALFNRFDAYPSRSKVTIENVTANEYILKTFIAAVQSGDESEDNVKEELVLPPAWNSPDVATFNVSGIDHFREKYNNTEAGNVTVTFAMDPSGIFFVEKAQFEVIVTDMVEIPRPKKKKTDDKKLKKNITIEETTAKANETNVDGNTEEEKAEKKDEEEEELEKDTAKAEEKEEKKEEGGEKETVATDSELGKEEEKEGEKKEDDEEDKASEASSEKETATSEEDEKEEEKEEEEEEEEEEVYIPQYRERKRRFKHDLLVSESENPIVQMTNSEILSSKEKLEKLHAKDQMKRETEAAKSNLEAYIYSSRSKVRQDEDIEKVTTEQQRESHLQSLEDAEDWLYTDEGENANKTTYETKHKGLKDVSDAFIFRAQETSARPESVKYAKKWIADTRKAIGAWKDKKPHIFANETEPLLQDVADLESFLEEKEKEQETKEAHEDAAFTSKEVKNELSKRITKYKKLKSKPAPKVEKPKTNSTGNATTGGKNSTKKNSKKDANKAEEEGGDETTESPIDEEEGEENGETTTTTTKTTDEDVDSNSESTDEPQPAKKSWFGKVFDKKEPEEAAAGDL